MTIAVTCTCGKRFGAPDKYAGKRVKCSACGQAVSVPTGSAPAASTAAGPAASCKCGARFRLTAQLSGKKVRCPKCKEIMQLPELPASQAGAAQPVVAEPLVAEAAPQQPNPWTDNAASSDAIWDELGPGANAPTDTSLFEEDNAPKPPSEMSSSEAMAYAIQQIHGGHAPEMVENDLVHKGMKRDDAERLVGTLVPERAKAHVAKTKASAKSSGRSGGRQRSARAMAADQNKRIGVMLCGPLLVAGVVGWFFFTPLFIFAACTNLLICFISGTWILCLAFQEDIVCGLLWLFVPVYGLFYIVDRWDDSLPYWLWGSAVLAHFVYGALWLAVLQDLLLGAV